MNLKTFGRMAGSPDHTEKMPVLFLGHGSPMNAIEENRFVRGFREAGERIPKPKAVLCISAHWETRGTRVTAMDRPRTIHDFGGFPRELFEVQYPAPGSPALAKETRDMVKKTPVGLDESWGLDHGAWSVIKHLFPDADVPVIQMSLDRTQAPQYHYELAKEIASLRQKGILIIGSGNMVHNLGRVSWEHLDDDGFAFDWAREANEKMKALIAGGDHEQLIRYNRLGHAVEMAVPTAEHYLPLLYILALKERNESVGYFNDRLVGGSISMTSLVVS
jgi:4,5-DOPA dioxygenase extradiol